MDLTDGISAESVLECVGMETSMSQAVGVCRPGGTIGYVGVPHSVNFDGQQLFFKQQRMLGGPAPVRRFLPDLMDRVLQGRILPGKAFDLVLPIDQVAAGYKARMSAAPSRRWTPAFNVHLHRGPGRFQVVHVLKRCSGVQLKIQRRRRERRSPATFTLAEGIAPRTTASLAEYGR